MTTVGLEKSNYTHPMKMKGDPIETPPLKHRMDEIFQNNKPVIPPIKDKWTWKQVGKIVLFSTVLAPIGILWVIQWLFAKAIFLCFKRGLVSCLLPAVQKEKGKFAAEREAFLKDPTNRASHLSMITSDGVELIGTILWSKTRWEKHQQSPETFDHANSKWVVRYNGNNMCCHDLFNPKSLSPLEKPGDLLRAQYQHKDVNIIIFDYRGVDGSGMKNGKQVLPDSAKDLILDGHTPIQMLKDKGVQEKNIFIEAISLGGGIGTQVASKHPYTNIGNINSFSKFTQCTHYVLNKAIRNYFHLREWSLCLAKMVAWVITNFAIWLIRQNNWEMDSVSPWKKIKGFKRIDRALQDEIMQEKQGALLSSIEGAINWYETGEIPTKDRTYYIEYNGGHGSFEEIWKIRRAFAKSLMG